MPEDITPCGYDYKNKVKVPFWDEDVNENDDENEEEEVT